MKAVVYDRYGPAENVQIRELSARGNPGRGKVRVRVAAAALNPKDILVRKGRFRLFSGRGFPKGVGYDFAGRVMAGTGLEPGSKVFGMVNGWQGRTVAEELICKEDECALMPDVSFEEAASLPLAGLTALQALRDVGRVGVGSRVCINGASGGVGTLAIQIAKTLGAHVTTLSSRSNRDLCLGLGADQAHDYAKDDPFSQKRTFHCVFDVFGNRTLEKVKRSLKSPGTFVSTVPSSRILREWFTTLAFRSQRARLVVVKSRARDLSTLANWVHEGRIKPVVDRVYELQETADAQRYLETRRARGKVIVRIAS